ncbi:hypothetical protein EOA33_10275 [Mesorhizobium sp. M4A.F.Ca.ET.050.02.1.1]|nr:MULTISPECIES: hypothetical protein [unclassified Mesorhizobium]RUX50178.1 hypothetical protein EOA33_10275 [Mesorhizobium sp. M4A.F.Ca.ET.050.02.1.1]RWC10283.1 MAG: hypothetical protein EOS53_29260 [Mesorhizobium sp.]RWD27350.1 MAG: hypothetical protein EOS33_19150 [Mesorhizobium sp.]RWD28172.1 MAG: hypothetical protein EOS22_11855 [Mesorhizobium sp.]TIW26122.1 MAG: hypothetical protein E5V63_14960 [Mesorhizobium sp.]
MRRQAVLAVVAAIMGTAPIAPAAAQTQPGACAFAPAILDAGDFLLAEPATFPNFWRDRFGDDAAYLKIRYGGLAYTEGSALLASLEKRSHPPQRIVELRLAYATTPDRAAMIAGMQPLPKAQSIVPQLGQSAWRALVMEDDGDWLLDELARLQTSDLYQASVAAKGIAQALSALDDQAKSQLAQRAEEAGVWLLALEMRAAEDDLSDYVAYLDRLPPAALIDKRHTGYLRNALNSANLRPFFDISKQPAQVQALDRQNGMGSAIRPIGQLIDHSPQAAILLTLVNQTGDLRLGPTVAGALNAQIAAKQLDPINNPDAVTAAMLNGIDYVLGRREREDNLRHALISEMQGETAESFVDRALARSTLAPFMKGNEAEPPHRPKQLTAAFPWEQWVGLAGRLKAGETIAPEDRIVAADLMIAANRPSDALALLKTAGAWKTAALRAHQLALDLDRRCADLLRPPVALAQPLYQFEPR